MTKTYSIIQNNKIIASITLDIYGNYANIEWNSETGLVTAEIDGVRTAIPYTGNAHAQILPGYPVQATEGISEIKYRYWYY